MYAVLSANHEVFLLRRVFPEDTGEPEIQARARTHARTGSSVRLSAATPPEQQHTVLHRFLNDTITTEKLREVTFWRTPVDL